MNIYVLEQLVAQHPYVDYTPKGNQLLHNFTPESYDFPTDAVRGTWGTVTSFKPGHDNSNAVEAARIKNLGSKQSQQHKSKKAAALRKKVCVDGVVYNSITEASVALGVGRPAISNRIKRGYSAWLI